MIIQWERIKYMKVVSRILVFVLLMIFVIPTSIYAREVADMKRKGSVNMTLSSQSKKIVYGAEIGIYKVGEVYVDNGFHFRYTKDFENLTQDINESIKDNAKFSEITLKYISSKNLRPVSSVFSSRDGKVSFENLELGLYYFMQMNDVSGFSKMTPFMVTIPTKNADETLTYDFDASPKMSTILDIEDDEEYDDDLVDDKDEDKDKDKTPVNNGGTTEPTNENGSKKPKLPQTGQLWWPIFVLLFLGTIFITVGAYGKKFEK